MTDPLPTPPPAVPLVRAIWIPGLGWLRDGQDGRQGDAFTTEHDRLAYQVARMWGYPARVLFVDEQIVTPAMQTVLLIRERERSWPVRLAKLRNTLNSWQEMGIKWLTGQVHRYRMGRTRERLQGVKAGSLELAEKEK